MIIFWILFILIILAISVTAFGFIFWGLGNLFVLTFGINFTFTFIHGLVISIIFHVITMSISKK